MQGGVLSTLVFCYDLRWRVQYSREILKAKVLFLIKLNLV